MHRRQALALAPDKAGSLRVTSRRRYRQGFRLQISDRARTKIGSLEKKLHQQSCVQTTCMVCWHY
jgi:hypothetical protein